MLPLVSRKSDIGRGVVLLLMYAIMGKGSNEKAVI